MRPFFCSIIAGQFPHPQSHTTRATHALLSAIQLGPPTPSSEPYN